MLAIQIIRAKGLPVNVKDDYFTTVSFCGEEIFCTEGCKRESNGDPVWQDADEFSLASFNGKEEENKRPLFLEKISIQVFADKGDKKAELAGEVRIPLFNIGPPRWYKLVPKSVGVSWDAQILITLSYPPAKLDEFKNISFLPFSEVLDSSLMQNSPLFLNFGDSSLALFGANPLPGPTCGEILLDYHAHVEIEMVTGVNLFKDKCSIMCKGSLYLTDLRLVFIPDSLTPSPPGFLSVPHVAEGECCANEESLLAIRRMTLQLPISGIQDIKCQSPSKDANVATLRVVCRNSMTVEFIVRGVHAAESEAEKKDPLLEKLGKQFFTGGLLSFGMPPLLWCSRVTEELNWMIREDLCWVRWSDYLGLTMHAQHPAPPSHKHTSSGAGGFVFREFASGVPGEVSKANRRNSLKAMTTKYNENFLDKFHPCVKRYTEVPVVLSDYHRLRIPSDATWNISFLNDGHELCSTYPDVLVFPASLSTEEVREASLTRSKNRLPSLVWLHPVSRTPLCRCAQPLAGISGVYEPDVKMCLAIRAAGANQTKQLRIVDCRPKINAQANAIQGKGFENVASLGGPEGATLVFADIHNIHVMREALQKVRDANAHPDFDEGGGNSLAVSKWLHHVAAVLRAAAGSAESLLLDYPVLVHCSDGWDRTAQVAALTQLLLDPYYRTVDGFLMLIEKEWIGFGYQFEERLGRMTDKNTSPVFTQYLDCVWQLLNQYPTEFEFSSGFLEVISVCVYSGYFSSFRGNCERERVEELARHAESTLNTSISIVHFSSVFTYLYILLSSSMAALLINPKYKHPGVAVKYLHPRFSVEDLTLWTQGLMPRGYSSFSQGGGRAVLSRVESDALASSAHSNLLGQYVSLLRHLPLGGSAGHSLDLIHGRHHGALMRVQTPHANPLKSGKNRALKKACDTSACLQVNDDHHIASAAIRLQLIIRGRQAMRKALARNHIDIYRSPCLRGLVSSLLTLFFRSRFKSSLSAYVMKRQMILSIINDVVCFVIESCEEMQRTCPDLFEAGTTRGTLVGNRRTLGDRNSVLDRDCNSDFDDLNVHVAQVAEAVKRPAQPSNNKEMAKPVGNKTTSSKTTNFFSKMGFNKSK